MANEHNKVSWSAHTLTASDGKDYYIVADSTDTDIPVSGGGLADGTLYYIYWDENSPYKYSTILASSWGSQSPAGKHIISEVTGQSSTAHHGTVKANLEYKTDVPTATKVNITAIGQQDSLTAATVSNMGTTATTGFRLKINTPGADAAGAGSSADSSRHWIRGFTANSSADNNGRWLDIDGYDQSITILDGATSDNWLTKMSASGFAAYDGSSNDYLLLLLGNGSGLSHGAGLRFFKGTQTAASDATAIAHYHAGGARFYNSSGMHSSGVLTNILMDIQSNNIRFHNGSGNIALQISSTGLTYYNATANTPSDATITSEQTSSLLTYYNSSGKGTANQRVQIGLSSGQSLSTYAAGNFNSFNGSNSSDIVFYSSVPTATTTWNKAGAIGLWRWAYDGSVGANNRDAFVISSNNNILISSANASQNNNGGVVDISADASGTLNGWRFHSSSDSGGVYRNFLYPFNSDGDTTPDGTAGEAWNYIGYNYPDHGVSPTYQNGAGSLAFAQPWITAIYSYYYVAGSGSATSPTYTFSADTDTGMYLTSGENIGFTSDDDTVLTLGQNGGAGQITFPFDLPSTSSTSNLTDLQFDSASSINQLIKYTSSARYKENIRDLEIDTSNIYSLRPVSYNAITEKGVEEHNSFGLVAEEVNEIYPELISYNEKGQPDAVSYLRLPVFLLAEIQKLRKELDELKEAN